MESCFTFSFSPIPQLSQYHRPNPRSKSFESLQCKNAPISSSQVRSRRQAKGDESLTRQSDNKCSVKWVIVTVITIGLFIFTRFWCTPTHVKSKPSSDFASRHWLPKLVYTKLARIEDVVLIQFLSDWLRYAADDVKARIPLRVWNVWILCH